MTSFADPGSVQQSSGEDSRDVQVNLNADVSGYTTQVSAAQTATAGLAGTVDKLSLSLSGLTKFAGRQLFHFAAADFAGLSAAVADAAALEHQMGTLRATATLTGASMGTISKGLDDAFSKFPVARSQLIGMLQTVQGAGITSPVAAQSAANTYTKLGFATGEDPAALAGGGIQLGRMMGNTDPASINAYANALTVLHAKFGVATTSILEFSQSIAPMARAAGIGQASVMGIATAFSAAGADGAYAANTFSKMVTEIQTMKETGDPEIAKYASFTGKTADQFKGQSATEDVTQLFSQIGKGGPEALNFVSSLGLGPRDLKAIQAVSQSGLLGSAVGTSRQASTNGTEDLDKAAKASMEGLTNSMTLLGHQFTRLGEIIGAPLLKPLTGLAKALGGVVDVFNKILSALGPIPGYAAVIAGALALPAAAMLTHFGLTSTIAVARAVNRGTTMTAFREGGVAGRAIYGGAMSNAAMAAGPVGQRFVAGTTTSAERAAYNYGLNRGALGPGLGSRLGGVARSGFGGVLGAGTWLANASGFRDRGGAPNPSFRESVRTGSVRGLAGATTRMVTSTMREGALGVASVTGSYATRVGMRIPGAAPVAQALAPAVGMGARVLSAALPIAMVASIAAPLVGTFIGAMKERDAKRADISDSLKGASVYDAGLDRVTTNLAKFGDAVGAATDKLTKFGNIPVNQLGTVSDEDVTAVQGSDYKVTDPKLTSVIDQAKKNAAKPGAAPGLVDKAISDYLDQQAKEGPIKGDAFKTYTRDILSKLGVDNRGEVSGIMTGFGKRLTSGVGTPDYGSTGALAGTVDTGYAGANDEQFKNIFGGGVSSLQVATSTSGLAGSRAGLANLLNMTGKATVGDPTKSPDDQLERIKLTNEYVQKFANLDPKKWAEEQKKAAEDLGTGSWQSTGVAGRPGLAPPKKYVPFTTEEQAAQVNARAFAQDPQGKVFLQSRGMDEKSLLAAINKPGPLPAPTADGTASSLRGMGPLGRYAAGDPAFLKAAVGSDSGNPGAEFAASIKLSNEAAKEAGGNFGVASSNLSGLSDKIGGATGALIASASDWADTLNSFRMPTLNRAQQYNETADASKRDMAAAQAPGATDRTKARGAASRQTFESTQENQRQVFIGQLKEVEAFDVSRKRAEESNHTQILRSNRDFATQQSRAEEEYGRSRQHSIEDFATSQARAAQDYYLSVRHSQEDFATSQLRAEQDYHRASARAQEDYQLQAQRSQEDYQKNVDRQTADHLRDLTRQAQAAAQNIYDPFTRVQVKATTDAGTLIYNLKEQNADIARQMKEIKELKNKGVSQQTIDTLQLGNADNAQQVTTLNRSLDQNPNMVGQINAQVKTRVQSTKALTQDPGNNVTFRQGEEDFAKSMSRASEDFSKAQKRAAQDHGKTMSRMSEDFKTTSERASQDQAKSLSRMSEAFSIQQSRAATDQAKALARSAEAFKISQDQAVKDHAKAMSDMAADYKKTQKQAAEDLATSMKEYSGNFVTIMGQLSTTALSALKGYAPQALAIIDAAIKDIRAKMQSPLEMVLNAGKPTPPVGKLGPNMGIPQGPPHSAFGGFAFGGISLTQQQALVSEHGPEAHIPLNSHGENFMASLIARSLAQGVTTATSGGAVSSTSVNTDNSISFAGADITVTTTDPGDMARQLAAKAKLARLSSPVRH